MRLSNAPLWGANPGVVLLGYQELSCSISLIPKRYIKALLTMPGVNIGPLERLTLRTGTMGWGIDKMKETGAAREN